MKSTFHSRSSGLDYCIAQVLLVVCIVRSPLRVGEAEGQAEG